MTFKIISLVKLSLYALLIAALIIFIPSLPPHFDFEPYEVTPSIDLEKLPRFNALDKAEVILKGKVAGAESVAVIDQGDAFYTGLESGDIVKYDNGEVSVVTQMGQNCGAAWGLVCGRPVAMRLDPSGKIVAAACDKGVAIVDPKTGKVDWLFDFKAKIQGHVPTLADDLDISQNGTIYWSDVSTNFDITNPLEEFLRNHPTGRLLEFDPKTNKNKVLIDAIHFANGVQLSQNEYFVLISETFASRILRYHLKGPKTGQHDVFMDGLPGIPDNIRSNGKGGFYIVLTAPRQFIFDTLGRFPNVRKFILRSYTLINTVTSYLKRYIPDNVDFGGFSHFIFSSIPIEDIIGTIQGPSRILDVDANGKILRVLEHSQNKISFASQITISSTYAYIGRFLGDGIWRIKMSDLD